MRATSCPLVAFKSTVSLLLPAIAVLLCFKEFVFDIVLSLQGEQWWFISLSVTWACGCFLNETQPKSTEGSAACGIFFPALSLERRKFLARETP